MQNFVQIERYIGTLVHHLHEIGRNYYKSEPIFSKLGRHHSTVNSVRYAKFRANRKIYSDFGSQLTLNQTKIYVGAISKSELIFTKLVKHYSRSYSLRCAKFRASQKMSKDFSGLFT